MAARYSGGHAAAHAGLIECLTVSGPKLDALLNAPFGDKDWAIFVPELGLFGGLSHGLNNGRLKLRALQQFAQSTLLKE